MTKNPLTDFSYDKNLSSNDDYQKMELINPKNSNIVCKLSDNESNDLPTQQWQWFLSIYAKSMSSL